MRQLWWFAFTVSVIMAALVGWNAMCATSVQGISKNADDVTVHGRDGTSSVLPSIISRTATAAVNVGASTNVSSATLSDNVARYIKMGGWCFLEIRQTSPITLTAASDTPTRIRYDMTDAPVPTNKWTGFAMAEDGLGRKAGGILNIDSDSFEVVFIANGGTSSNIQPIVLQYRCD